VSPIVPLIAGLAVLVAGVLLLRTYGPNYRVGRLLASTPEVGVAEARGWQMAAALCPSTGGSIPRTTSRTTRIGRSSSVGRAPAPTRRGWVSFEDRRERVPFEVRDGLDGIAIDDADLDTGLVVVPRESIGLRPMWPTASRGHLARDPGPLWVDQVRRSNTRSCWASRPRRHGAPRCRPVSGRPLVLTP
jgi:hypothetical protein